MARRHQQKFLGSDKGRNLYQWYLSIYALRRGAYRLRYQSPGNGGPLSRVTRANGVKLWFPTQEIDIVGAAALMHRRTQELVVASHETGADCGGATVTVLAAKPGDSVGPVLSVENPCDLNAKVAADGLSIEFDRTRTIRRTRRFVVRPILMRLRRFDIAMASGSNRRTTSKSSSYIRKTPNCVRGCGACAAASRPIAITRRVSSGSMMPSSHKRAVE